ncbi:MAG: hypothetical protein ACK40C_09195 [Novosphingobium meiothermophilum]
MQITELLARWNTDEGKPYKGLLIYYDEYKPGNLSCMCAQGQVLYAIGGWSPERLRNAEQIEADKATAELLRISRAHAVLLRHVNDKEDGAPSVVLTDPGKVLGDQWSKLLDFWSYMDTIDVAGWLKVYNARAAAEAAAWAAAEAAARDAAWAAAWAAARAAAWAAARDAAWAAAWAAARAAAWAAAWASNEIQGREVLEREGKPFFFLPMFGFASPDEIPARSADYGVVS